MSKKLKILIPVFGFIKSGGFRVLTELANHWIEDGHQVTFLSFAQSADPYYPTKARIIWIDINGIVESNSEKNKSSWDLLKVMRMHYHFLHIHSKEYDVVLANYNLTVYSVFLASKTKNFYYIQAYEPDFFDERKGIKNSILRVAAWFTYFLPLTKVVNAELYRKYKNIRSNFVIPPGLDLDVYYPKILKPENKEELIIGCIGREEVWKGSKDVAEAVAILHQKGYRIKFLVAFNAVEYPIHELVVPDGDLNLANYYRSLDVLVAPGHIQLGAVHYPVIEAMACNVPVITTGYFPADSSNSFIVPIKDPKKIAATIESLTKNYNIAFSKAEKARVDVQQFDWEIISKKFIDIFLSE